MRWLYSVILWPQILDQSYHLAIFDTQQRDEDQILSKILTARKDNSTMILHCLKCLNCGCGRLISVKYPNRLLSMNANGSMGTIIIYMSRQVSQWRWVTILLKIVVAFKDSANKTLIKSIGSSLDAIQDDLAANMSPEYLVALVVQNCISFFDYLYNIGLDDLAS